MSTSQSTFGDNDLSREAAAEIRADVKEYLDEAQSVLPDSDDMWEADADNVLGVLNGLRSSPGVEGVAEHIRQAKKWYVIGQCAEMFDDPEDLEAAIKELEALIEMVEEAHEPVEELTNTMPQLRGTLTDAVEAAEATSADEDEDEDEGEE